MWSPQGSILGYLLIIIYVYMTCQQCLPILFADDNNMFITGRNIDIICQQLTDDDDDDDDDDGATEHFM